MKVALLAHNYYPSIGGTQILLQSIAETCIKRYGDEFTVYTTDSYYSPHSRSFEKINVRRENVNGVVVERYPFFRFHLRYLRLVNRIRHRLRLRESSFLRKYLYGPWSPLLLRSLNKLDADVILASSLNYSFNHYPLIRHKLKRPKPFLLQGAIHFDLHSDTVSRTSLEVIKASDIYIANTDYEKQRLVQLGVDHSKIEVIGCGVKLELFKKGDGTRFRSKLKMGEDEILVGYIGRIQKTKSIDSLIRAYALLPDILKTRLVIAGSGEDYLEELKSIAAQYVNDVQKIIFVSDLSEQEKADIFNALDIFVLPSTSESFGIVFLEAWACKKPVVGMNMGAIAAVVTDNKDGLLVSPENIHDLADKIGQLICDKERRIRLGEQGYKKIEEKYTWDIIASKYRLLFEKAIRSHAHKRLN